MAMKYTRKDESHETSWHIHQHPEAWREWTSWHLEHLGADEADWRAEYRRLKAKYTTANEIALVVFYPSGGKITRGGETLLAVIQDGRKREPKTSSVKVAYTWLQANNFEPVGFIWLDAGGGLSRRRKQTYRRN